MAAELLHRLFEVDAGSCVAFVGGGGKTSLMLELAEQLQAAGQTPVVTTTTKIWVPESMPLILQDDADELLHALASAGVACFGRHVTPDGKVEGIARESICALFSQGIGPLLVEADGSAGRPLKMHADYEPVIPLCSTHVLMIAGVDALGHEADGDTIHRTELARLAFGWSEHERISPAHVAALLTRMAALVPSGSRPYFVLNKVDSEHDLRGAREIAARLTASGIPVLMTSRGRVVPAEQSILGGVLST
jgi:probable selenium-dependent hydroxylase accessory protein YqeC